MNALGYTERTMAALIQSPAPRPHENVIALDTGDDIAAILKRAT